MNFIIKRGIDVTLVAWLPLVYIEWYSCSDDASSWRQYWGYDWRKVRGVVGAELGPASYIDNNNER